MAFSVCVEIDTWLCEARDVGEPRRGRISSVYLPASVPRHSIAYAVPKVCIGTGLRKYLWKSIKPSPGWLITSRNVPKLRKTSTSRVSAVAGETSVCSIMYTDDGAEGDVVRCRKLYNENRNNIGLINIRSSLRWRGSRIVNWTLDDGQRCISIICAWRREDSATRDFPTFSGYQTINLTTLLFCVCVWLM